uniref:hypothetical protein n=1 Tax=Eubacterium cellulosolvens TaxID=29322 RepID=UPI000B08886D|nr:hypothetical protein [[Eubacterium] cellulosolvens]
MKCGKKILTGILAIACVLSSGCAFPGRTGSNQLSVDEKGVLTEKIQESDSGGGYTEEELKQYITDSIRAYDSSDDGKVRLDSCKIDRDTVKIEMTYKTVQDYSNYNKVPCYLGTLDAAKAAGFDVDQKYLDESGKEGDAALIRQRAKEWKVFIVSEPVSVRVSDKILYATDNVSITGRLTAEVRSVREEAVKSSSETVMSASGGLQEEASPSKAAEMDAKQQEILERYTTVADKYAYIIFK